MAAPIFDTADVEKNRLAGGLGYILPFVPYLACKDSAFGRYCANQGLILWICLLLAWIVFGIVGALLGWLPLVGALISWIIGMAHWVVNAVLCLVMLYFTFIACTTGRANEVPVVGTVTLLK